MELRLVAYKCAKCKRLWPMWADDPAPTGCQYPTCKAPDVTYVELNRDPGKKARNA